MVIGRVAAAPRSLGRVIFRRAGAQTRSRAWRQAGRRHYASQGHSEQKSSELPWIIGSLAGTVPAAIWLLGQGPKQGDHGHHEEKHEEKEEKEESKDDSQSEESSEEESKDEKSEEKQDSDKDEKAKSDSDEKDEQPDSDDSKEDSSDESSDKQSDGEESKSKNKNAEGEEKPSPNAPGQINYKPESGKGPGEGQKGPRPEPELKGEKMSKKDHSGAQNPYLDDDEKSKKGEGVKETAKIHGTVDPRRPAR